MPAFSRVTAAILVSYACAQDWPQFHGPLGNGIAFGSARPPVEFNSGKRLIWKTAVGEGHGSPVLWGTRVFLLTVDRAGKKLNTVAMNAKTGKVLWTQSLEPVELEKVHEISNQA